MTISSSLGLPMSKSKETAVLAVGHPQIAIEPILASKGCAKKKETLIMGYVAINDWIGGKTTPLKNMKVSWDDYSQYVGK